MPKITQLPILNTATTQTYFLAVDNSIAKRLNYNSFATTARGYTGSSGLNSRLQVTTSTGLLAYGSTVSLNVTAYKSYALTNVATSDPAMVRLYCDNSSRVNDSQRPAGHSPVGAGLIAEILTTATTLTHLITPAIVGFNNDTVPSNSIYMTVTNNHTGTVRSVSVTLTLLPLES